MFSGNKNNSNEFLLLSNDPHENEYHGKRKMTAKRSHQKLMKIIFPAQNLIQISEQGKIKTRRAKNGS